MNTILHYTCYVLLNKKAWMHQSYSCSWKMIAFQLPYVSLLLKQITYNFCHLEQLKHMLITTITSSELSLHTITASCMLHKTTIILTNTSLVYIIYNSVNKVSYYIYWELENHLLVRCQYDICLDNASQLQVNKIPGSNLGDCCSYKCLIYCICGPHQQL